MQKFIDNTIHFTPELHTISKLLWYNIKDGNCLSLGPGAGSAEINLLNMGWDVTCVDKLKYSKDTMCNTIKERKIKNKKIKFIINDFNNFSLNKNKKLNYVMAISSLPFSDKENLYNLFSKIIDNSENKCVFSINFFTNKTTLVKNKECFGMNKLEINKLCKHFDLQIKYIDLKLKIKKNNDIFEIYDIIAIYNKIQSPH